MLRNVWRLIRQGDVGLGRKWQARLVNEAHATEHAARRLFLEDFRGDGRVSLGRAQDHKGAWHWVGLPPDRLLQARILTTGASGTGKSRLIAAAIYQLLRLGVTIVLADFKGELAGIVLDTLVPALVAAGVDIGPIRVIRPFDPAYVPMLRLSEPDGFSREVQALNLASSLGEAVGADLRIRMHRAFLRFSTLAIETNLPLTVIADWASNPATFIRAARSSSDPQVRHYALHEFPRESRASLDGLRARLDELFHLREIRLSLSAPRCLSFPETLESGVTVIDLGGPPAGAEAAAQFIGGPIMGRLARAILSRPVIQGTKPCLVIFEEFQELLGRHQVEQFKRLLSLSRFKLTSLWFSNQQVAQIADVDPMLLRILRTNVSIETLFRCSPEDASKLSQGLSIRRPDESLAAARARFTEELASLPRREFHLWVKDATYGPQRIRSPRLDLDELNAKARGLDPERRAHIQRGVVSVPVEEVRESAPEYPAEEPVLKPRKKSVLG